jgi:hypothetical protein
MIRAILVAAAALGSVSFSPGHAESAQAPWCAVIELDPGTVYWDCVSLVRRLLPQRQYFGWQQRLLQSEPVLRRWTRGAKADPETSRLLKPECRANLQSLCPATAQSSSMI